MKTLLLSALFFFFSTLLFSQNTDYSTFLLPKELTENANAIIRLDQKDVVVSSQRSMSIKNKRIITILNENGVSDIDAMEYYNPTRKVKKIEAIVYDASGKEIKSFKKRDFKDISAGDGFSIFLDNRMIYLDYTPIQYPFTVVFESEIETSNTAFISPWFAVDSYYVSTQKAILNVSYLEELGFKYKEANFSSRYTIKKEEGKNRVTYTAENIHALKGEESSPKFIEIAPVVYMKVEKFNLEGVDGEAKTWEEWGKWYYDSILAGTDELPQETQNKIKQLVGDEKNPIEIAKIVYKFVQDKTRYVSIQVGIGGYKPMLAKDVDRLGYGDCKGLSNYMRSLLKVVNVPSYDVLIYGDRNTRSFQSDFVSQQGNHMIVCVPDGDNYVWLECTNQNSPFAYQGTFTDNRDALVIKPDGGHIVKTKSFADKENSQITKGGYSISADGNLSGGISIVSKGIQYDAVYGNERLSVEDKDSSYKKYFDNINNLKLHKITYKNERNTIEFTQNIELSATGFAGNNPNKLIFVVNAFNCSNDTPKRYRNRENSFELKRGFYDYDEITITMPSDYLIETIPQKADIISKYGEYQTEIVNNNNNTLTYKRTLFIKSGLYENKDYEEYRLFREQISRNDNAKIILNKKV